MGRLPRRDRKRTIICGKRPPFETTLNQMSSKDEVPDRIKRRTNCQLIFSLEHVGMVRAACGVRCAWRRLLRPPSAALPIPARSRSLSRARSTSRPGVPWLRTDGTVHRGARTTRAREGGTRCLTLMATTRSDSPPCSHLSHPLALQAHRAVASFDAHGAIGTWPPVRALPTSQGRSQ